jgi:hypothetical protein
MVSFLTKSKTDNFNQASKTLFSISMTFGKYTGLHFTTLQQQ